MGNLDKKIQQFDEFVNNSSSGCGAGGGSCCDTEEQTEITTLKPQIVEITIDGQVVSANNHQNIVEVAKTIGVIIPAPCYAVKRKTGCCHGCLVEVDGEHKYACATRIQNGMQIVVDRIDLKEQRKQNILKYNEGVKSGKFAACSG